MSIIKCMQIAQYNVMHGNLLNFVHFKYIHTCTNKNIHTGTHIYSYAHPYIYLSMYVYT